LPLIAASVEVGSEPPFAAVANQKNWIVALNVRFLQIVQSGLHPQRKSGFRPWCYSQQLQTGRQFDRNEHQHLLQKILHD